MWFNELCNFYTEIDKFLGGKFLGDLYVFEQDTQFLSGRFYAFPDTL